MNGDDHFTFYGDLLGIAAAYQLGPQVAYEKLNRFYNTVFEGLAPLCDEDPNRTKVNLFSDSLVVWGSGVPEILQVLQRVYLELFRQGLLLRGALVSGALEREPRVEVRNLVKFLPTNDTLARAVGLEKTVKGARLLIQTELARRLLGLYPAWLTLEGYIDHRYDGVREDSILRRICPTPSGTSYELLYFWATGHLDGPQGPTYSHAVARLREIAEFQEADVAKHLRETLKLVERCNFRQKRTEQGQLAV